jgi:hypothetical protein
MNVVAAHLPGRQLAGLLVAGQAPDLGLQEFARAMHQFPRRVGIAVESARGVGDQARQDQRLVAGQGGGRFRVRGSHVQLAASLPKPAAP